VDFYSKTTNYKDKKLKLQIWDFGGEERFKFLLHQYCKGANAAFFLYNITNPNSLVSLPDWTQIIREHAGDIPIMLIGTHADLVDQRAVTREEGIQAAKTHNLSSFIELSAKTGQNVEKAFDVITEILFERYRPYAIDDYKRFPSLKANKPIKHKLKNAINIAGKKFVRKFKFFLKKLSNWLSKKVRRIFEIMRFCVSGIPAN
jgi:small GTP-binding protein